MLLDSLVVHELKLGRPGDVDEESVRAVARELGDGTGAVPRRDPGLERDCKVGVARNRDLSEAARRHAAPWTGDHICGAAGHVA